MVASLAQTLKIQYGLAEDVVRTSRWADGRPRFTLEMHRGVPWTRCARRTCPARPPPLPQAEVDAEIDRCIKFGPGLAEFLADAAADPAALPGAPSGPIAPPAVSAGPSAPPSNWAPPPSTWPGAAATEHVGLPCGGPDSCKPGWLIAD